MKTMKRAQVISAAGAVACFVALVTGSAPVAMLAGLFVAGCMW